MASRSAADDVIYGGAGLHGIEGGGGADLIDARDVTPGTGTSPEGYDLEIDGGQGDDTIVIGEGSTLLRGGAGSATFVLSTLDGVARGDEIVFADADSSDRLLVPYDLFNGSGGDYEGSDLLPVLGAHGRYDDMVTEGWTLLFDWRSRSTGSGATTRARASSISSAPSPTRSPKAISSCT